MTRVNINGVNHQVEIHHDGADLTYVVEKAQKLWDETRPAENTSPAFGYSTQVAPRQTGPASLRHNEQPVVDR